VSTSFNAVWGGFITGSDYVKEGQRAVFRPLSMGLYDRGLDEDIDTNPFFPCGPQCGTGDEQAFAVPGWFAP
jgi:hypothetical protein